MTQSLITKRRLVWTLALAWTAFGQSSDYDRGVGLVEKGRYGEALPLLGRAAKEQPNDARRWKALGVAFAAEQRYEMAEPAFARACQLDPKLLNACYYHGRALYALDRFDASLEVLERAARNEPESWKIRLGIAEALAALGKAAPAEASFVKAMALGGERDPQPGAAYGRFLVKQGRASEALPILERVVGKFPESGDARTQLGRALLETGAIAAAIPHLERAVALAPDSAQAHVLLARAYTRAGRAAEAKSEYEAAARSEPSSER